MWKYVFSKFIYYQILKNTWKFQSIIACLWYWDWMYLKCKGIAESVLKIINLKAQLHFFLLWICIWFEILLIWYLDLLVYENLISW